MKNEIFYKVEYDGRKNNEVYSTPEEAMTAAEQYLEQHSDVKEATFFFCRSTKTNTVMLNKNYDKKGE